MNPIDLPFRLLISLIIGAVIGLERETYHLPTKNRLSSVGLRTFSLISTLGTLAGIMYAQNLPLFIFVSAVFGLLVIAYYVLQSSITKDVGITTEIGMLFTYVIGIFIGTQILPMQLILAIVIVLVLVLSRKEEIRGIIVGINREEFHAFVSYALIALVILPFLPNTPFTIQNIPGVLPFLKSYGIDLHQFASMEILNPFRLWFIVALITGIDMAGYTLERIIGKKHGRLVASLIGGFISSTSTTQSLALESKRGKGINRLLASAIFANLTSFLQVFILIAPLNGTFLVQSTPTLMCMILAALGLGFFFFTRSEESKEKEPKKRKPILESEIFALTPALRFALIFVTIRLISKIALFAFGNTGLYITSVLASFTGLDAVLINVAEFAGKTISYQTAIITLILVNATNLLSKAFFSYLQGSRIFAIRFLLSMLVIIAASMIGLLFV
ncbi:MAG: DUF4010 domain-containing protein [Candidatus Roizmanbacteria bacterium]|nr:DUF4010 domain-containing protein [Candidatus Roizmanbacteria bacterium]